MTTQATESPFDNAWFEASSLSLRTLVPGVEYTLVRHRDSSDAGRSELFFADESDASRYVTRLKAAAAAGALDQPHFHPWPPDMPVDLLVFTVTRRV